MVKNSVDILLRYLRTVAAAHVEQAERGQTDRRLLERFVRAHDEAAFAALLERHGPMVLGVCRRALRNEHLAEEVLQATFLVLARSAGAIRKQQSLAGWLHGAALRLAHKARAEAARAARGDRRPRPEPPPGPAAEASWREVRQILDEELQRLPQSYRLPLVLCYLEGWTRDEAAAQLGWTPGRLKGLLERGRERLRGRLIRRGLAPAAAGAMLLAETALASPVAPLLAVMTLRAALRLAAGASLGDCGLSGTVIGLSRGGLGIMGSKNVSLLLAITLALGILSSGAGVLSQRLGPARAENPDQPAARLSPPKGVQLNSPGQTPAAPTHKGAGSDDPVKQKPPDDQSDKPRATGARIDAAAVPDKAEIMLGEPSYLSFKVANHSDRNLRILVGGDYRNRLGRPNSFKVEVVGADGKKVPQPDSGFDMGGITGAQKLPARGEYLFRLFLPHWATFEKPGRYTFTIRRKLELFPDDESDPFRSKAEVIDVTATATVTVVATDPVKLGKLITELGSKMFDRTTVEQADQADEAQRILAAIEDERVIPYFAELAQKPHFASRLAACAPLGRFKNDEALEALKKLAGTTAEIRDSATTLEIAESSADNVRQAAVHAIAGSPHPKAMALLWTFADDRYYGVRLTVLHRAAELNTPEARAVIEKMTSDSNEAVRKEAIRYLKERSR
jgi:RNA polymerase sigma factor (sigma-70 family)